MAIEDYIGGFTEEPGYLDYGRFGPLSAAVVAEIMANTDSLRRSRFGVVDGMLAEDVRMRAAAQAVLGFDAEHIVFQPNTSTALMQVLFGLTGDVLLSPAEFPSLPFAAARASEALHVSSPIWLAADGGRVTPSDVRAQITASTAAVAVSLVDYRTGHVADLEGIRQVIGDRLLIVDAVQGLGVVDAAFQAADVVASGGQKWLRAGWGTGVLALSDQAIERLTPVLSGHAGTEDVAEDVANDEVMPPARGARAFGITNPDYAAEARLAAAFEEVADAGVERIQTAVSERVDRVIALADEFAVPVVSSREPGQRAGLVVLGPEPQAVTALTASFFNHGVTVTTRGGTVRLSVHAGTGEETLAMARQGFVSFAAAR